MQVEWIDFDIKRKDCCTVVKVLKKKELEMLAYLRSNGRMKLTMLSKRINVPVSTLYDKLKLFQGGLIKKHTTLLDFTKLGYHTKANIILKVNKEHREDLREHLRKNGQVNSVYKINSGFDFLVEGVFKHVKDVQDFIEKLEDKFTIEDKQTYFIIDEIKKEGFMANPELVFMNDMK